MPIACWIPKTTNTQSVCNTYCFSTTTMVAQTRLNVTSYVNCLSCWFVKNSIHNHVDFRILYLVSCPVHLLNKFFALIPRHDRTIIVQSVNTGVSVGSRLRAGRPKNRGSNYGQGKKIFFLQNVQTSCGPHPACCSMVIGGLLFLGHNDRFVKKSARLRLVPNLRVSEPTPLPLL